MPSSTQYELKAITDQALDIRIYEDRRLRPAPGPSPWVQYLKSCLVAWLSSIGTKIKGVVPNIASPIFAIGLVRAAIS